MRLQQVTVSEKVSNWIELKQSVPQRHVLGSLLFNLYNTDLSNHISEVSQIIEYADDWWPFCSDSEQENAFNRLQESIVKLEKYFSLNRLILNDIKTGIINFSRKIDKHLLHSKIILVGSSKFEKSNQYNYLGVTVDEQLDVQTENKTVLKKTAAGVTTIVSTLLKFLTTFLLRFFHALDKGPFKYSALLLLQSTSPMIF